jgi:hypothetical protein
MMMNVKDLREGMLLKDALKDSVGRLLLPAGAILTARHIAKLQQLGIKSADVDSAPAKAGGTDGASAVDAAIAKLLCERVDAMFAPHKGDPLMADLASSAKEQLLAHPDLWSFCDGGKKP